MGRFQILGDDIQMVEIILEPGEGMHSEPGAMLYMDAHIEMEAKVAKGRAGSPLPRLIRAKSSR